MNNFVSIEDIMEALRSYKLHYIDKVEDYLPENYAKMGFEIFKYPPTDHKVTYKTDFDNAFSVNNKQLVYTLLIFRFFLSSFNDYLEEPDPKIVNEKITDLINEIKTRMKVVLHENISVNHDYYIGEVIDIWITYTERG